MSFENLGLNQTILDSISKKGYTVPTEIQAMTIPILIETDRDFVGQARTGTGKTAAFLLPLLQRLDSSERYIQSLIMVPTRELAIQVKTELDSFSEDTGIHSSVVYGGAGYQEQIRSFKVGRPQVVIATPGRLMDLLDRKVLDISRVKIAILDEADEMLNMGFLEDVKDILGRIEGDKHMWMFSATLPPKIQKLVKDEFSEPLVIKGTVSADSHKNIQQFFFVVKRRKREMALERLLASIDDFYGVVFCQTREEVRNIYDKLDSLKFNVFCLHGEMSQKERSASLNAFKKLSKGVLVCTDVAARGIDIDELNYVVNMGLPQGFEAYTHRVGRTGRAGKSGIAYTIINQSEVRQLSMIEQKNKYVIKHSTLPNLEDVSKVLVDGQIGPLVTRLDSITEGMEKNPNKDNPMHTAFQKFQTELKDYSKEAILKVLFQEKVQYLLRNLSNEEIEEPLRAARSSSSSSYGGSSSRSRTRSSSSDYSSRPRRSESSSGGESRYKERTSSERAPRADYSERNQDSERPRRSRTSSESTESSSSGERTKREWSPRPPRSSSESPREERDSGGFRDKKRSKVRVSTSDSSSSPYGDRRSAKKTSTSNGRPVAGPKKAGQRRSSARSDFR